MKAINKIMIAVKYGADKKTRWVQVGTEFAKDDGRTSILLDAGVNLAAYAEDGKVWANRFPIEEKGNGGEPNSGEPTKSQNKGNFDFSEAKYNKGGAVKNEEIPF